MTEARANYLERQTRNSSVVAPAPGEAVFIRLCKSGVWLQGRRCRADTHLRRGATRRLLQPVLREGPC